MSIPLSELRDRSVTELPDGVTVKLVFRGVSAADMKTGQEVFLTGPVDLNQYATLSFKGVSTRSGRPFTGQGISFRVSRENGIPVDRNLNSVSKRFIERMKADLATGDYLKYEYSITAVGPAPTTEYQVARTPLS